MEDFNFDQATIGRAGVASFGSDNALHFVWKKDAVEVTSKTEELGRKIFTDVECCEVHFPGFKNILFKQFKSPDTNIAEKKKLQEFFALHPKAKALYKEWKEGQTNPISGTPLSEWPILSEAERAELRSLNIFTLEQICESSDMVCQQIGPKGREWRTKAQAWMETAKESATAQKFAAENQRLRDDLDILRKQIEGLSVQTMGEAPKKRGRPRKDSTENVETTTIEGSDE